MKIAPVGEVVRFHFSIIARTALSLAAAGSLFAQEPSPVPELPPVEKSPIEQKPSDELDGLTFPLPVRWKKILEEKTAALPSDEASSKPAPAVKLLLHAKPEDDQRSASLSVVRDEVSAGEPESTIKQLTLARLTEIAAEQGYKVEKASSKGRADSPNNVLLTEVYGVSGDGRHRIFTCISINRSAKPAFRCFLQCDEADMVSRRDFDDLIATITCDDVLIADILWSGAPMAATTSSPGSSAASASASPSTDSNASSPTISPRVGEMVSRFRDSLVVIEGENGRGSGFVCKVENQPWLMTNIHVLGDNPKPRFTTMNGKVLTPGTSLLGVDHDIFRGSLTETGDMLEVMTDLDTTAKIGDAIAVLGNPEGAGVIKPIEGRIVGIGPNLVEVDAPFVPGNSGSPIIHLASGKVIGIATYLIIRKVDTNDKKGVETTVRRFGYRVDNVEKWEPVNWAAFYAQSAQAAKIKTTGEEFVELFKDAQEGKMRSSNYTYPGIQRALENLERSFRLNSRMSTSDAAAVRRRLLSELRNAALSDIVAFDSQGSYDFFRRQVAEEKKFRDDIYAGFTRVIEKSR